MIPLPDHMGFFRYKVGQLLGLRSQPWTGHCPYRDEVIKDEKSLFVITEWAVQVRFRHTVYLHVIQIEHKYIFALMLAPDNPIEQAQNQKWYAQVPIYITEVEHWEHAIQDKLRTFNLLATDDVIILSDLNWHCILTLTTGHVVSTIYLDGQIKDKGMTDFFKTLIHAIRDITGYFEESRIQKYRNFLDEQVMPAIKVL